MTTKTNKTTKTTRRAGLKVRSSVRAGGTVWFFGLTGYNTTNVG